MSFDGCQLHAPGTIVAGYTIRDVLGTSYPGAAVYHAKKKARSARLKVITSDDARFRERCTYAWSAFRRVDHANVLAAREMIADRQLMFATEYVSATSLAKYLARAERCSRDLAVHIVASIASALDAGASEGLRHLNLKPTNVLLAGDQGERTEVYVTDFGMARQSWDHVSLEIGDVPPSDLLFIPPECLVAGSHERSDVYSLGMIAYVLLGGLGTTTTAPDPGMMLWSYANGMALPILGFNSFTDSVAEVLVRATARNPDERPASGRELSRLLAQALNVVGHDPVMPAHAAPEPIARKAEVVMVARESRSVSVLEIVTIIIVTALVSCACTALALKLAGVA